MIQLWESIKIGDLCTGIHRHRKLAGVTQITHIHRVSQMVLFENTIWCLD